MVREDGEKYELKINNEHDKVFRTILDDKKEAISFINKVLDLTLEENEIEKYKENYVTENLINKETDIVYKIKNRNVFILIEHQTKIDYSMPYRIMRYQYEIITSAIDIKKLKQKLYKIPIVIPIVLYTGRKKWDATKYIKESQESFYGYEGQELGKYKLVDVNDYTEEELLKERTFLSKAMLIESKSNTENIVEYLDKIIDIVNKDNIYTDKQRKLLSTILNIVLRIKIDNNIETNRLIDKINIGGEKEMLALVDNVKRENRRLVNQGKREEKIEIAKKMKNNNYKIEQIVMITGLKEEVINKI
jgi:predicted transposase/invertase (TIGR01784 family)